MSVIGSLGVPDPTTPQYALTLRAQSSNTSLVLQVTPWGEDGTDDGQVDSVIRAIANSLASEYSVILTKSSMTSENTFVSAAILDDSSGQLANHYSSGPSLEYVVPVHGAGTYSFNVALSSIPTDNVTVDVSPSGFDGSTIQSSVSTITFTPSNYDTPQEVTLTFGGTFPVVGGNSGSVHLYDSNNVYVQDEINFLYVPAS